MRLSVIVASSGRPTLGNTLLSISPQLKPGDELLVDINDDGAWGSTARNRQIERATGDMVMFMDDDDEYTEGAFDAVRAAVEIAPDRVHLFRMRYSHDPHVLWIDEEVRCGNVSTQMVIAPRRTAARFSSRYEGDFDFIEAACAELGPPVWHEQVIALVRPPR
jgi:Glycosyl transferase family 2